MPRSLKLYITGLVVVSGLLLIITSLVVGFDPPIRLNVGGWPSGAGAQTVAGLAYWIILCMAAQALPVRMPGGMVIAVSFAPIIAAMALGGPAAAGWGALLGVLEVREGGGEVPWYGSLANHAAIVPPAILGGFVVAFLSGQFGGPFMDFVAVIAGATVMFLLNLLIASIMLSLRMGVPVREMLYADARTYALNYIAVAPLGWLMAKTYATTEG